MVSAIWSMPPYEAKQMPLKFFLKFFQNHSLFNLINRPQWYTIKNRKAWSSWNSSVNKYNTSETSITYWLNLLQNLKTNKNIFLSLNPFLKIDPKKIISKVKFTHPYYDKEALENQNRLKNIQNKKNLLFCGSYFGYGFHEDGIKSSLEMIKSFNDR